MELTSLIFPRYTAALAHNSPSGVREYLGAKNALRRSECQAAHGMCGQAKDPKLGPRTKLNRTHGRLQPT